MQQKKYRTETQPLLLHTYYLLLYRKYGPPYIYIQIYQAGQEICVEEEKEKLWYGMVWYGMVAISCS